MKGRVYFSGAPRADRGTTLIELLAALTVSMLLISLIASSVLGSATATSEIHNRVSASHDANLALDYLAEDFASIVPATFNQGTLSIYPETVAGGKAGDSASSAWITLLSHPASAQIASGPGAVYPNQGAVTAVSYRLAYQDPIVSGGPEKSFALYRSVVPLPPATGAVSPSTYLNQANPTDFHAFWLGFWPGYGSNNNPPLNDYLLGDVVKMQVTLNYSYRANATDTVAKVQSVQLQNSVDWTFSASGTAVGIAGSDLPDAANVAASTPGASEPISVNVSLTVLRARGASLYANGSWTLTQAIQRDGVVVSRNLPIRASSVN